MPRTAGTSSPWRKAPRRTETGGEPAAATANAALAGEVRALLAGGDHAAARRLFGVLVERCRRRAARIAYHYLRDPVEVEDALQDAFLKVFTHLPAFRAEPCFDLWLARIVVNGCLDRLQARTRRRLALVGGGQAGAHERLSAGGPSPEAALLARESRRRLLAAVDRLPRRQRSAVLLTRFEGHSTQAAGAILGLSEATVRVHLFRAVRTLRKRLRDDRARAGRARQVC